jgi:exosortase/archaeosortase family protein
MTRATVLVLALQVLAGWPAWRWWLARVRDGSDEPWGVVALAALLLLGLRDARHPPSRVHLGALAAANLALAAAHPLLPPMVHAALAVLCVTSLLARASTGSALHIPTWLLALLSLPVLASVQFYLGYPLRVASAVLAVPLLRLHGLPVLREGVDLRLASTVVQVDAPCSGARMLWVGLFLAVVLAHSLRLGAARTLLTCALAGLAVVLGNALRVSALALVETGRVPGPDWLHEGVGAGTFVLVALAILSAATWLRAGDSPREGVG